jgi:hypothetical protein
MLEQGSCNSPQKLTYTFVPVALHTLQLVYRVRNERVREFLQRGATHIVSAVRHDGLHHDEALL